ncbi:MAG: FtsX-like permease family protein [Bacteroidales bacterium]|nr:FtsX-like permease family protein [Bacteroidales bacterium]
MNIISILSVSILALITSTLIIVLSVLNGFDILIKSFFNSFDPEFKIVVAEGKVFPATDSLKSKIANFEEVAALTEVLEENVMLVYNSRQDIARIKGVSESFNQTSGIDSMIINGEYLLKDKNQDFALLGYLLSTRLSLNLNLIKPIKILAPRRNVQPSLTNMNVLNTKSIFPIGVFSVFQEEYDSELIIVPIEFCRKLLEYHDEVSAIDIKLHQGADPVIFQEKLEQVLGNKYVVKNRYQQHEFFYKIMESEKWAGFLILAFILVIASFNLTGSLTMLIIDKKDDIVTLQNMGASNSMIRRIFLLEGWFISIIGALGGILLGLLICWGQIKFGWVSFPENFMVQNYPVALQFMDFVYVFFTVVAIGFIASWYPVRYITKKHLLL